MKTKRLQINGSFPVPYSDPFSSFTPTTTSAAELSHHSPINVFKLTAAEGFCFSAFQGCRLESAYSRKLQKIPTKCGGKTLVLKPMHDGGNFPW